MELVSDLATHFGHEGPTHDIPGAGTRYIQTSHSERTREVKHSKRPDSCARVRTRLPANVAARWIMLLRCCSKSAAPLTIEKQSLIEVLHKRDMKA